MTEMQRRPAAGVPDDRVSLVDLLTEGDHP
ncbi:hypothetical protein SAMN05192558_104313 [Actinokineospora alba]|uniref:Uncharacterized protein n=1 Tax=Actinokineospora alba TaxID=504798 RepID=A0A1H0LWA2_9PSEU|nr:hypothetical protein C8E96_3030 [Actinokineospora alba]SDI47173.1 hypothetical protein SAMN05421871_105147 [Actinokineospora alba]SDO72509.1 hypothetical protein SAMN05192558_104313 [Actinokineospora alba]